MMKGQSLIFFDQAARSQAQFSVFIRVGAKAKKTTNEPTVQIIPTTALPRFQQTQRTVHVTDGARIRHKFIIHSLCFAINIQMIGPWQKLQRRCIDLIVRTAASTTRNTTERRTALKSTNLCIQIPEQELNGIHLFYNGHVCFLAM